jgi:hypothetical protein
MQYGCSSKVKILSGKLPANYLGVEGIERIYGIYSFRVKSISVGG